MKNKTRLGLLVGWLVLCAVAGRAQELRGRVVSVADGDTITILDATNQQHKIRFNGIDAPEKDQAFGQAAKQNLASLVFGKDVVVQWSKRDKYGRTVGTVFVGSTNANLEQLRGGFAWFYRQYISDIPAANRSIYERAEAEARAARRGLWSQPNPQPPWEFRHGPTPPTSSAPPISGSPPARAGQIIGNRNSLIYHRPDCPDYGKVSERNRVPFGSEEEAQRAGYRRAGNCR